MTETRTPRLALLCDRAGVIQKILCDDFFAAGTLLCGQIFAEWVDPGSRDKVSHLLAEVNAQGSAFDWELNVAPQGKLITLHFSGFANDTSLLIVGDHNRNDILQLQEESMRINNELVNTLRAAIKDQIAREQAEKSLRVSEERYRLLANNIPDIIYSIDGEGNIVTVNSSAFERYGYSEQDSQGKPFLNFIHPEDRGIVLESFLKALEEQRKFTQGLQFRIVAQNSFSYWFELNSQDRFDNDGHFLGEDGVLRDITERKQIEESLRQHQIELKMQNEELRQTQLKLVAARNSYFDLYDLAPVGYITVSEKGLILEANQTALNLLGVARSALHHRAISRLILKEDQGIYYQCRAQILETNESTLPAKSCDLRMVKWDKTTFWSHLEVSSVRDADGAPVLRIALNDITERKLTEQALNEMRSRLQLLGENLDEAALYVYSVDANQQLYYEYLSPSIEKVSGVTPDEILRDASLLHALILPEYMPKMVELEAKSKRELIGFELEVRQRHAITGNIHWVLWRSTPRRRPDGSTVWYGVQMDITERKRNEILILDANEQLRVDMENIEQLQAELREQAIRDPLTGLFNRHYLNETLAREFARAERENDFLSVIMSDIDYFKIINDTYGHPVGDKFLVEIANLLKNHARGSDMVYRYGGEEFLLVFPSASPDSAVNRAEEFRQKCAELVIQYEGKDLKMTMSFGVATYPIDGKDAEEIIIKADIALYRAKAQGRNCTVMFE